MENRAQKVLTGPAMDIAELFKCQGQRRQIARGSTVFYEGEGYKGVFFLYRGTLKWFRLDNSGNECVLKFYSPGEVAGLAPLFDRSASKHYVATLRAITDAEVSYWAETEFHVFMRQNPEYLPLFSEQMCSTLKDLVEQTSAVSLKSVPMRLYDYLERLGARLNPVRLPLRKHELASALNTCPESLSRAFGRLARDGHIFHEDGKYRLQAERAAHRPEL